jgi:GTPase involved in cell partitioning and DNA repair
MAKENYKNASKSSQASYGTATIAATRIPKGAVGNVNVAATVVKRSGLVGVSWEGLLGKMNRFNVAVTILANVGVNGPSPQAVKTAVISLLQKESVAKIAEQDFVIEHSEVTGIFDANWREIDVVDIDYRSVK